MHRCSSRAGFTLIELMVVIAVIGTLAAILFPVFSTAREKARQTKCQAHLMQLVTALNEFHADNGRYPDAPVFVDPDGPSGPDPGHYEGGFSALYPDYITDQDVFICPDDREALQNLGDCRDRVYCSYNGLIDWNTWEFLPLLTSGGQGVLYNYFGYTYSCELLTDGDENCDAGLAGYSSGYDNNQAGCILPTVPGHAAVPTWMNRYEPDPAFPRYIPDFLEKAGLSWQHFPALANRGAPDYTIVTHCPHHRKYYDNPDKKMDVIVTLGGQTSLVNVTDLGDPDSTGVPPIGWQGTTDPVAGWVHQNF